MKKYIWVLLMATGLSCCGGEGPRGATPEGLSISGTDEAVETSNDGGVFFCGKNIPSKVKAIVTNASFASIIVSRGEMGITKEQIVTCDPNAIDDLDTLAALPNLEFLSLQEVEQIDTEQLAEIGSLTMLDLSKSGVTSIAGLAHSRSLRDLWLNDTAITDLGPLLEFVDFCSLNISNTPISDLSPISGMKKLLMLDVSDTEVTDLGPIAGMDRLLSLNLSRTRVEDFSPLKHLVKLTGLMSNDTQFSDLTILADLEKLSFLYVNNCPIMDFTPLRSFESLESLGLDRTAIKDLEPLSELSELKSIDISETNVTDLSPLHGLKNLRRLRVHVMKSLSDEQIEKLQRELPDLEISSSYNDDSDSNEDSASSEKSNRSPESEKKGDGKELKEVESDIVATKSVSPKVEWVGSRPAGVQFTKSEITVAQYRACVKEGSCKTPDGVNLCNWYKPGRETHPMNCVDWFEASSVCAWLGGRLPTEEEWHAEASNGGTRYWPWGDGPELSCETAVWGGPRKEGGCGLKTTWPVCQKPLGNSVSGLCDMSGNVWEWTTADTYDDYKVVCGGAFGYASREFFSTSIRDYGSDPSARSLGVGVRCVRSLR